MSRLSWMYGSVDPGERSSWDVWWDDSDGSWWSVDVDHRTGIAYTYCAQSLTDPSPNPLLADELPEAP